MNEAESAFLVGIRFPDEDRATAQESLEELKRLTESAGAKILGTELLELRQINPATLIGKGHTEKIAEDAKKADLIIVDADLSPVQQRNIEDTTKKKTLDRAGLILDIFAQRARSAEGKIQVELAQLRYLQTRLVGKGVELSQIGGGIGTRGPGETKLELDRRKIKLRVTKLRRELEGVRKTRKLHRSKRTDRQIPTVAIIGYTNSGKSTLINKLTDAGVLAEDRLFATLDPTTRKLQLPTGQRVLISDTVGFIRRLPHQLVDAFRATFEETLAADLLLHVIDYSYSGWEEQATVVDGVLKEMEEEPRPVLRVYNKVDRVAGFDPQAAESASDGAVYVSAANGDGLDKLLWAIAGRLKAGMRRIKINIPVTEGELIGEVYNRGWVISRKDMGMKVKMEANVEVPLAEKLKKRGFVK